MNERGTKEIVELLRAAQALAVLVHRAQRGGGSAAEIGQRIAGELLASPQTVAALKAAADGIGDVPAEAKDLSFAEALELIAECGRLAADAARAIRA